MPEQDAVRRQAQAFGRPHVVPFPLDDGGPLSGARVIRPLDQHEREHDVPDPAAKIRQHHQRDQDRRKRELQVDQAHDRALGPTAAIGGKQAEGRAHHPGDRRRASAHPKADAKAVEDARKHVPPLLVRPERVDAPGGRRRARGQSSVHDIELQKVVGILWREPRREQGGGDHEKQDDRRNGRQR